MHTGVKLDDAFEGFDNVLCCCLAPEAVVQRQRRNISPTRRIPYVGRCCFGGLTTALQLHQQFADLGEIAWPALGDEFPAFRCLCEVFDGCTEGRDQVSQISILGDEAVVHLFLETGELGADLSVLASRRLVLLFQIIDLRDQLALGLTGKAQPRICHHLHVKGGVR